MAKKSPNKVPHGVMHKILKSTPNKINKLPNINKAQYYGIAALLFLLPFIYSRFTLDPVITPRYMLVSIFTGFFILIFFIVQKKIYIFPLPILITFTFFTGIVFIIWSVISLFFAINPIAGIYEIFRELLNVIILFIIINLVVKDERAIFRISTLFLFISTINAIIGIFQYYEIAFIDIPGANALPYGLMANRNLFASAQLFTLPFVFYVFFTANKTWKIASVASFIFLISSIIISQTRSVWIGTAVFVLISSLLLLIFLKEFYKKIAFACGGFILIVLLITLLFTTNNEGKLSEELKQRGASLFNQSSDTSSAKANINDRITIWKKTAELIKDQPTFGTGVSNWRMNILSYGSKGLAWSKGNYVPDRVHNILLQTTAETGFLGLIIFISHWILIGMCGFLVLKKSKIQENRIIASIMIAGLLAVATDSMFSFPFERIEHCFYISLISGFILGLYFITIKSDKVVSKNNFQNILIYSAFAISLINIYIAFSKYKFETGLKNIKQMEGEGNAKEVISYAAESKTTLIKLDGVAVSIETKEAMAYRDLKNYPKALELMQVALKLNPNSSQVNNNLGTIYTEMKDFNNAIKYYERALVLTPDFDIIKKNLAVNYFNTAQYQKCINILTSFNIKNDTFLIELLSQSNSMLKKNTSPQK